MALHENEDGTYCISRYQSWLPGVFENIRAARFAFRLTHMQLLKLQESKGVIGWGDIQTTLKEAKLVLRKQVEISET